MADQTDDAKKITLMSPAFKNGDKIPVLYTCDGDEISPPLSWSGAPGETKSFTMLYQNHRDWTYWTLYNIPADKTSLPAGIPEVKNLDDGNTHGINSEKLFRYFGPCSWVLQDSFFRILALDIRLNPDTPDNPDSVKKVMTGHILAEGRVNVVCFREHN